MTINLSPYSVNPPRLEVQVFQEREDSGCVVTEASCGNGVDGLRCGLDSSIPGGGTCVYCSEPVCVRHNEPCYECGFSLHPGCRDDHAKESKHSIEIPKGVEQCD